MDYPEKNIFRIFTKLVKKSGKIYKELKKNYQVTCEQRKRQEWVKENVTSIGARNNL
jgi:hypothetical protein